MFFAIRRRPPPPPPNGTYFQTFFYYTFFFCNWPLHRWPSTTKYQPVPPHIDSAPPNADQNCLFLTQYYNVTSSSASGWPNKHHISTYTVLYWPSTTKHQPVQPHTDPAPPITNLYRLLLTKYRHISTSSSPYWPSTTKYEPVPPHTGPVPPVLWYVEIFKCQTFLGRPEMSTVVR